MSNLLTPKELEEIRERWAKVGLNRWYLQYDEDQIDLHILEETKIPDPLEEGGCLEVVVAQVGGAFWDDKGRAEALVNSRDDVSALLQHIEELEKALRDATDRMAIETITSETERGISNGWRKVGKTVITHVGYSEKYIAFVDNEAKELWAWLRTKEAGSGEGEKDDKG